MAENISNQPHHSIWYVYECSYEYYEYNRPRFKQNMPSTRSKGQVQPALPFPRRKSCRPASNKSTVPLENEPPAPSPEKCKLLPQSLTSVRLCPITPLTPTLSHRIPLSPRKRTGRNRIQNSPPLSKHASWYSIQKCPTQLHVMYYHTSGILLDFKHGCIFVHFIRWPILFSLNWKIMKSNSII